MQDAAHGPGALWVALLQIRTRDAVEEQRVASDQRAIGDEQPGHVGRVARQSDRPQRDRAERHRVAVVQRLDVLGVGDAALQGERRQPQRRSGLLAEHPSPGEVIGMQVGVQDIGDARSEFLGKSEIEADVWRRVHHKRVSAGGEQIGQAAAAGALDLSHEQSLDSEVDGP